MSVFEKGRAFVYRNARPLDLARFQYHFENGAKENVLNALKYYQNEDGGFAYAIEPDNWNERSTPVGTWAAIRILKETVMNDPEHPLIQGILDYLRSEDSFMDGKWLNTVPSNNLYPHAVWWHCGCKGDPDDNPTVSLAGFILRSERKDSGLYSLAELIAKEAYLSLLNDPPKDQHTLSCYADLLSDCEETEGFELFDLKTFREALAKQISNAICQDPSGWTSEYVCTPSFFYRKNKAVSKLLDPELCVKEAKLIKESQLPDGSFPVTWVWHNDYREYEIAANWWKSDLIIRNLLFLEEYGKD